MSTCRLVTVLRGRFLTSRVRGIAVANVEERQVKQAEREETRTLGELSTTAIDRRTVADARKPEAEAG